MYKFNNIELNVSSFSNFRFSSVDLSYIEKFEYIFHLIYSKSVFNAKNKKRNQWVILNAWTLQRILGVNYKKIVDFLEESGFIEVHRHYIKGKQSMGYKLAPKYLHTKKPRTYGIKILKLKNIH